MDALTILVVGAALWLALFVVVAAANLPSAAAIAGVERVLSRAFVECVGIIAGLGMLALWLRTR
jgi:hypothetical protein